MDSENIENDLLRDLRRSDYVVQQPSVSQCSSTTIGFPEFGKYEEELIQGIREYMDKSHLFTNRTIGVLKFFYLVIMALFNVAYIFYKLAVSHTSDIMDGVLDYRDLKLVVEWLEALAVSYFVLRFIGCAYTVHMSESAPFQASDAIESLDMTGSFSFLQLLPCPPKIVYWWNIKFLLLYRYVIDPESTGMHWLPGRPQFRPWTRSHWNQLHEKGFPGSSALLWYGFIAPCTAVSWFFIRCVVLVALIVFIVLSPAAALVKVYGIPTSHHYRDWKWYDWLSFLGVLNQMSKLWSPNEIEMSGLQRHIAAAKYTDNFRRAGAEFRRLMIKCFYKAAQGDELKFLAPFVYVCFLDVQELGVVLNQSFGAEEPYTIFNTRDEEEISDSDDVRQFFSVPWDSWMV